MKNTCCMCGGSHNRIEKQTAEGPICRACVEQVRKAFSPDNHQWLKKWDNLRKSNKEPV